MSSVSAQTSLNLTANSQKSDEPSQWLGGLFFLGLLGITLSQNFYDLLSVMDGAGLNLMAYEGPLFIKLLKDAVYASLLALAFVLLLRRGRLPLLAVAIITLIFAAFALSTVRHDLVTGLIGLRWSMPLFLFLLMAEVPTLIDRRNSSFCLIFGLLVCIGAQIYQLFNMPPIYGEVFGLAARTPGFFLAPNSAAFFACASAALVASLSPENRLQKIIASALALAICLLAQSGTGIITAAVLIIWQIAGRINWSFVIVGGLVFIAIFLNLNAITMRNDYLANSGGIRVQVFVDVLSKSFESFGDFGVYTNAAILREGNLAPAFVLDSLWASLFGNLGLLSLILLPMVALFIFIEMRQINWHRAMPAVITFFLFSMTTIVFEAFPMNLLVSLAIWCAQDSPRTETQPHARA
jgi:hypothetical protein